MDAQVVQKPNGHPSEILYTFGDWRWHWKTDPRGELAGLLPHRVVGMGGQLLPGQLCDVTPADIADVDGLEERQRPDRSAQQGRYRLSPRARSETIPALDQDLAGLVLTTATDHAEDTADELGR